ncbi:hypothetical protein AB0M23_06115 [Streptomyces sp. NPDC052077]|uniref:hypothetical protein n=1 Tax=Streptomyces sp. NPDC052077 TaxID=3154757 RepID=UPI0034438E08
MRTSCGFVLWLPLLWSHPSGHGDGPAEELTSFWQEVAGLRPVVEELRPRPAAESEAVVGPRKRL